MKLTDKSLLPYYKKINLDGKEKSRTYIFPGGEEVIIIEPVFLIVSDNGHRLYDKFQISHYVPYGWIHLYWENYGDRSFYCEGNEKEKKEMLEDNKENE